MIADGIFPEWLAVLRAHDYRVDRLPPDVRLRIAHALNHRGIRLWRPGDAWASNERIPT